MKTMPIRHPRGTPRNIAGVGLIEVLIAVVILSFVIPFFTLLSRGLKFNPRGLAFVSVWILIVHWVDLTWLVMPALHPEGFFVHWTGITSMIGVALRSVSTSPSTSIATASLSAPRTEWNIMPTNLELPARRNVTVRSPSWTGSAV